MSKRSLRALCLLSCLAIPAFALCEIARSQESDPASTKNTPANRRLCFNNLKQIGLAMHIFHDKFGSFPPSASYDEKGKPLLSWRVYILPYLDQKELYKQFHLDEPWDSEHNKALIEKMPSTFECPAAGLDKGMTTYLAPVGSGTVFDGKQGIPLKDITDGTTNTILVVDANKERAVVWTKPDDLAIDFTKLPKDLGGQHGAGFCTVMCDGTARFWSDIPEKTLKLLFQRNDGEPVRFPQ